MSQDLSRKDLPKIRLRQNDQIFFILFLDFRISVLPDFCISVFLDFWIFVGFLTITWARRLQLQQSRDHSMIPKKSIILHKLMPLKGDKSLGGKEAKLILKPSAHINKNLLTLSKIHASVLFSLMTKCINEICRDPFLKIPASTAI